MFCLFIQELEDNLSLASKGEGVEGEAEGGEELNETGEELNDDLLDEDEDDGEDEERSWKRRSNEED